MCTLLDGKSYQLLQLSIDLYDAVRNEAHRLGLQMDVSAIDRIVREAQALVMTPLSDDSYHKKPSDEDLTEPHKTQ